MKRQDFAVLFFLLLIIDIIGIETGNAALQYLSKPLLMPVLTLYFYFNTKQNAGPFKKWVLFALFFSWAGDVLLMFQDIVSDFFLFGLSAFLLAHIFYIFYFHEIRAREGAKTRLVILIPIALYYAALIMWLTPFLDDMQMPVSIYGVIICFMLFFALQMLYIRNINAGKLFAAGALLFVISDSLLAVNKFFQTFSLAGTAVMLTYGLAQYLIVCGACLHTRQMNSK